MSYLSGILKSCAVLLLGLLTSPVFGQEVEFERDIAPILEERCTYCHGEDEQESGLRLDPISDDGLRFSGRIDKVAELNNELYLVDIVPSSIQAIAKDFNVILSITFLTSLYLSSK